ncbi:MAG: hypothetical protein IT162_23005 [Bryobacterales bacterium]|nr:hypothetical protein [Bryobacterales bacterium]
MTALLRVLMLAGVLTLDEQKFVQEAYRQAISNTSPPARANLRAEVRDRLERCERATRDLEAILLRFPDQQDDQWLQLVRDGIQTLRGSTQVARRILQRTAPPPEELRRQVDAFVNEYIAPALTRLRPLTILARDPGAPMRMTDADAEFAMEHLARVERACEDRYAEVALLVHADEQKSPALWCRMAGDRFHLTELARGR